MKDGGSRPEDPLWQEAHRVAAQIRRDWPDSTWSRQRACDDGHTSSLLQHVGALGDIGEIDAFLAERTANGAYGRNDNQAITEALGQVPSTRAS